jgi:hypothetical protein
MPPAGFETAIPVSDRLQTHTLDRSATGIGHFVLLCLLITFVIVIIKLLLYCYAIYLCSECVFNCPQSSRNYIMDHAIRGMREPSYIPLETRTSFCRHGNGRKIIQRTMTSTQSTGTVDKTDPFKSPDVWKEVIIQLSSDTGARTQDLYWHIQVTERFHLRNTLLVSDS